MSSGHAKYAAASGEGCWFQCRACDRRGAKCNATWCGRGAAVVLCVVVAIHKCDPSFLYDSNSAVAKLICPSALALYSSPSFPFQLLRLSLSLRTAKKLADIASAAAATTAQLTGGRTNYGLNAFFSRRHQKRLTTPHRVEPAHSAVRPSANALA